MILDIELTDEEISNLEKGGFFILYLFDGVKITITKDTIDKNQEEK